MDILLKHNLQNDMLDIIADGVEVGFIQPYLNNGEHGPVFEIAYIHIEKKHRRNGIARATIDFLSKNYTITGQSVPNAREFWVSVGAIFGHRLLFHIPKQGE